ncbi:Rpn family recombination-promoting nuclease/putative transposase [Acetivibrio cellulolyticus]|uniref:Rpn family recombination-promoting nuclease/putative transposase n=1 Tax=Acetivibrio cellulolyticus TaxID=35830 RepID=UPI00030D240F|nr:Rpn family recombination-promoting nuclease/putative transposase [Acetivibrio cellulolyticus]
MQRLNPLNDYIFKRIMGEEESKDNLIAFLNAVLDADDRKKLVSLEIVDNKELTKEMISDKSGRLDVRAKTADGVQLDIEVQLTNQHNMKKRTMFYWGKLFLEGIKQGDDYINLSKVITINILDFEFLDLDKFHSKYHLWEDAEENYLLTDLIEIHFIETPKFKTLKEKDLKGNPLHRWLKFFDKMLSEEELKELIEMDSAIKRAEKKLEYLSSDAETLALYKAREDSLHERANMISSAKLEKALEIAKNMMSSGLDIVTISKFTEIPVDELKRHLKLQ